MIVIMRKLGLFILAAILLPCYVLALDSVTQIEKESPSSKWNINLSPMALFDYSPRYRVGIEYFGSEKWSYGLDLGYGDNSLTREHAYGMEWADNYKLNEARLEIKYYFSILPILNQYVAFETFYIGAKDKFYNEHYYPEGQEYINSIGYLSTDYLYVKSGSAAKYGVKWYALKRLFLEGFIGLGAARRAHRYENMNLSKLPVDLPATLYGEEYRHEGASFVMHFSLAFKIGYAFY